jgi:hypothetical protein
MSKSRSTLERALHPLLACAALLLANAHAAPASPSWRAAAARENITPQEPLWMTGYATRDHPAEGAAQQLWVKALAFEDPAGQRGVLLTADLCGITRAMSERVAAELGQRFKLPRSAVMTNASHTHAGPWIDGYLPGLRQLPPADQQKAVRYRTHVEDAMIRAAAAALESLAPATLAWSADEATFGVHRRNNLEKDVPALRAAGKLRGPMDPRVPVLAVRAPNGELRALLVSYACHNTTLMGSNYQWHGDYAGCAQLELERRHPGAVVLFAMGCGGDINPQPRGEIGLAEEHGRELADAADRSLAKPMQPIAGKFASAFDDIVLTFSKQPTEEKLREAREKNQPFKEMYQAWSAIVSERLRTRGDDALRQPYAVQAWRLGALPWVALSGEPVVEYSLRLRQEIGSDLWVLGYSNDVMCYIPNERTLKEGRYEGDSSMIAYGKPSPWSPGLEEKIIGKARELVTRTQ